MPRRPWAEVHVRQAGCRADVANDVHGRIEKDMFFDLDTKRFEVGRGIAQVIDDKDSAGPADAIVDGDEITDLHAGACGQRRERRATHGQGAQP
jgi:hypothetical protein